MNYYVICNGQLFGIYPNIARARQAIISYAETHSITYEYSGDYSYKLTTTNTIIKMVIYAS